MKIKGEIPSEWLKDLIRQCGGTMTIAFQYIVEG